MNGLQSLANLHSTLDAMADQPGTVPHALRRMEEACGPDSPMARSMNKATAAMHATADRVLAPLQHARAASERCLAAANAHRERLEAVPASRSRFSLPADLTF